MTLSLCLCNSSCNSFHPKLKCCRFWLFLLPFLANLSRNDHDSRLEIIILWKKHWTTHRSTRLLKGNTSEISSISEFHCFWTGQWLHTLQNILGLTTCQKWSPSGPHPRQIATPPSALLRPLAPSYFFLKTPSAKKLGETAGLNFKTRFSITPFAWSSVYLLGAIPSLLLLHCYRCMLNVCLLNCHIVCGPCPSMPLPSLWCHWMKPSALMAQDHPTRDHTSLIHIALEMRYYMPSQIIRKFPIGTNLNHRWGSLDSQWVAFMNVFLYWFLY